MNAREFNLETNSMRHARAGWQSLLRCSALIIFLSGCVMSEQFSFEQIRSVFANTSVKVVVYVPPKADPKSIRNQDVYAWLNSDLMPGSMGENIVWVCDSSEQAVLLAQKRSQALASTNMGDVYGGPLGWVVQSGTELKLVQAKAFMQLEPGKSIGELPVGARRFVMRNLVFEAAPMPRNDANQMRAQRFVEILEAMQ
jgi:hypothetical protein